MASGSRINCVGVEFMHGIDGRSQVGENYQKLRVRRLSRRGDLPVIRLQQQQK